MKTVGWSSAIEVSMKPPLHTRWPVLSEPAGAAGHRRAVRLPGLRLAEGARPSGMTRAGAW